MSEVSLISYTYFSFSTLLILIHYIDVNVAYIYLLLLLLFMLSSHKSPSEETHNGGSNCFGDCDETVCSACYYSNETLTMPTLKEDCPALCPVDAKGEIFGMTCLRKWGKCVRNANVATYGKVSRNIWLVRYFISSVSIIVPLKFIMCLILLILTLAYK